ncbi:MAG: D-alanine--D-alanine ligase [Desulfovibrio sp.]|nr:D-alanine--D-alanine ligase [Desulfovibrio sp.]
MKILLLAGGWSPEREVSLKGAKEIEAALAGMGHRVSRLDPLAELRELPEFGKDYDFIFINMHGSPGEDGLIQAMIEKIPAPYNGSGAAASMIALNKYVSKIYYREAGLRVCPEKFAIFAEKNDLSLSFEFPAIMKANTAGSSANLFKLEGTEDLERTATARILDYGDDYLIEPMVKGMDVTCPVMGNAGNPCEALPPILIKPAKGEIFDYIAKYTDGGAEEICPAPLPAEILREISEAAKTAHRVLGLSGFSRSDFMVDKDGRAYILETNTLPGMTPNSLLPKSAKAIGMSFEDLLAKIIELGIEKFEAERQ